MDCLNCPLIQEEIERRLNTYGFEEMEQYPQYEEDILNEICRACFCDKFDSKIFMTNSQGCEDYPSRSIKKGKKGRKRRTRREYDACLLYTSPAKTVLKMYMSDFFHGIG